MRKIAFSCLRGSTQGAKATVSLGAALAARGSKTLVVDADVHSQVAGLLGIRPERGLAELIEGTAAPEDVIVQARRDLWMILGGPRLARADKLVAKRGLPVSAAFAYALEGLGDYDFVLLNTPPVWDSINVGCLLFADELVVPVDGQVLAPAEMPDFNRAIERIRRYRPELQIRCVVPRTEGRYARSRGPAKRQGFYQLMTMTGRNAIDLASKRASAGGGAPELGRRTDGSRVGRADRAAASRSSRATAWRPRSGLR